MYGIEAVDDDAKVSAHGSGMDKEIAAQTHGDMAWKIKQVAGLHVFPQNRVYGKAFRHGGIPIDQNPIEHIGHGAESRAVDTQRALAAPAVLCAQIGFRGLSDGAAKDIFLQRGDSSRRDIGR